MANAAFISWIWRLYQMDASRSSIFRYTPRTDFFLKSDGKSCHYCRQKPIAGGTVIGAKGHLMYSRPSDVIAPVLQCITVLNNAGFPVPLRTVNANCDTTVQPLLSSCLCISTNVVVCKPELPRKVCQWFGRRCAPSKSHLVGQITIQGVSSVLTPALFYLLKLKLTLQK